MARRFAGHPQLAWLWVLLAGAVAALTSAAPALAGQSGTTVLLAGVLIAVAAALGVVVAGLTFARPHVVLVQALRRTQAPPAWSVTRIPRTPRRPRAPGGR